MNFVLIESPFSSQTRGGIALNVKYAFLAVRDSLSRGEAPYASHLFFTQILDDSIAHERELGINAGLAIGNFATKPALYLDLGVSPGMRYGLENAKAASRPVEERRLFPDLKSREDIERAITDKFQSLHMVDTEALDKIYGRIIKNSP